MVEIHIQQVESAKILLISYVQWYSFGDLVKPWAKPSAGTPILNMFTGSLLAANPMST